MPISYLPSSSTSTEYINTTSTRTHNNNVNSTSNDPINQNTDHITTIVPSNAQNLTSHQSNQNQIQTHQYRQQNLVNEHPSTHQQYSVALVDGQGVRSYYSSSTGSAPDRDHTVPPPPDNSDHTVHTTYSYPYGYPSPAHTDKGTGTVERETVATAHALQTIQTMILQVSQMPANNRCSQLRYLYVQLKNICINKQSSYVFHPLFQRTHINFVPYVSR